MRMWSCFWCLLALSLALNACGRKNMVVLVPDPDGSIGRIEVSNAAGSVVIDEAHQATIIKNEKTAPADPKPLTPGAVQALFADVLSAEPPPPVHFILYFESDAVRLLPESSRQVQTIIEAYRRRMPTRVSVVGHTDTLGDEAYNVALSLRRATAIQKILTDAGVDETAIDVSSHGEANPLVKTADNVANAQNRRVEVIIR